MVKAPIKAAKGKETYLTIRLFVLNFCGVIVDEGATQISYFAIEIESELSNSFSINHHQYSTKRKRFSSLLF